MFLRCSHLASIVTLLAAMLATCTLARADESVRVELEVTRCMDSTDARVISAIDCPELFALLARDASWFAADLAKSENISREALHDLYSLSAKPEAQGSWQNANTALDNILRDYEDLKNDEPEIAERFFDWLAKKLDGSTLGKRIAEFGDRLRLPPQALKYVVYALIAMLAAFALVALFVLIRTLYLNVSPRGMYGTSQNPRIVTGEERGNAPVLSIGEIRALPSAEQPAALLVAAVDFFRGKLLPDNPWTATNAEISSTVSAGDASMSRSIETLIHNAERTLYGEKPVTEDQLRASFQAATKILGSSGPTELTEENA